MVVYAVWDRVARVRFPAPRQSTIKTKVVHWTTFVLIRNMFHVTHVSCEIIWPLQKVPYETRFKEVK